MKFLSAHLWPRDSGAIQANAIVEVPGIGEVQFHCALSEELCNRVREEAIAALRLRLGQTLVEEPPVDMSLVNNVDKP